MTSYITSDLIERARKAGACEEALAWAEAKPRTMNELRPEWAYWLRRYVDLPADVQHLTEEIACRKPEWAYRIRRYAPDLSPEIQRLAEDVLCRNSEWAYWLLRDVPHLSPRTRRLAEKVACREPRWAYELLRWVNLPPRVRRRAKIVARPWTDRG